MERPERLEEEIIVIHDWDNECDETLIRRQIRSSDPESGFVRRVTTTEAIISDGKIIQKPSDMAGTCSHGFCRTRLSSGHLVCARDGRALCSRHAARYRGEIYCKGYCSFVAHLRNWIGWWLVDVNRDTR